MSPTHIGMNSHTERTSVKKSFATWSLERSEHLPLPPTFEIRVEQFWTILHFPAKSRFLFRVQTLPCPFLFFLFFYVHWPTEVEASWRDLSGLPGCCRPLSGLVNTQYEKSAARKETPVPCSLKVNMRSRRGWTKTVAGFGITRTDAGRAGEPTALRLKASRSWRPKKCRWKWQNVKCDSVGMSVQSKLMHCRGQLMRSQLFRETKWRISSSTVEERQWGISATE